EGAGVRLAPGMKYRWREDSMGNWRQRSRGVAMVVAAGASVLVGGCGSSGGGQSSGAAATSMTVEVPQGFDPCNDIPSSVLDSLQLHSKIDADYGDGTPTHWVGCQWVRSNYYSVSVRMTNVTLDAVRQHQFQDTKDLTIAGRPAISSRQAPDHPDRQCTIDVQVKGGSIEFFLGKGRDYGEGGAGELDACDMAQDVATKITPLVPASL
ncbi:MAG: DUF3558 domain-containing protein, partial [Nocardia sp.]|nr:DUF3558 domain-containing protein [Nocardia sp.]